MSRTRWVNLKETLGSDFSLKKFFEISTQK